MFGTWESRAPELRSKCPRNSRKPCTRIELALMMSDLDQVYVYPVPVAPFSFARHTLCKARQNVEVYGGGCGGARLRVSQHIRTGSELLLYRCSAAGVTAAAPQSQSDNHCTQKTTGTVYFTCTCMGKYTETFNVMIC